MAVRRLDILEGGPLPILKQIGEDEERSDYRNVPASDRGNLDYSDQGMFGSFTPDERPYLDPPGVRHFTGYGATAADLDRGYVVPGIREDAAYDKANYQMRSTDPKHPDEQPGDTDSMQRDWEFRARNQRSRGFLTRPRIPTER
jgi:hypothetical protein